MSATAAPISPERFASAIVDLPIGNLHSKAAEIGNAILHLENSNVQLQRYADDGDRDCLVALKENSEVIGRMHERIDLLKAEVLRRGLQWPQGVSIPGIAQTGERYPGRSDVDRDLTRDPEGLHDRHENLNSNEAAEADPLRSPPYRAEHSPATSDGGMHL